MVPSLVYQIMTPMEGESMGNENVVHLSGHCCCSKNKVSYGEAQSRGIVSARGGPEWCGR